MSQDIEAMSTEDMEMELRDQLRSCGWENDIDQDSFISTLESGSIDGELLMAYIKRVR